MTEELGSRLKLSVFRSKERYQIVNIKDFSGLEEPYVFAYGFTEKGIPVLNSKEEPHFRFNGSVSGHVNLVASFYKGILINNKKKVIGIDALVCMLSNYGLGITKEELEAKLKIQMELGAINIYCYKQSSVYGMAKAYNFENSWFIKGKEAVLELDHWNTFLKSIGSSWRILTPKTRLLLRKLEYQKLQVEGV